ncbi:chromosome transmission fidelity protein 8 homolog [Arctopsyche grandis]|uniref:chromosome transmission fidelity protein 8 homolog n=1 Tax=Arctopsyche grandis TaxID=121162 RepID=UPI00406D9471
MPPLIRIERPGEAPPEWAIIELQGDLKSRTDASWQGQFVGDLHYAKNGQPILIIGHHILHGKEAKMEKPIVVLVKQNKDEDVPSQSSQTVFDSTFAVERRTETGIEYCVKAIVKKKLIFKIRPKPIIVTNT